MSELTQLLHDLQEEITTPAGGMIFVIVAGLAGLWLLNQLKGGQGQPLQAATGEWHAVGELQAPLIDMLKIELKDLGSALRDLIIALKDDTDQTRAYKEETQKFSASMAGAVIDLKADVKQEGQATREAFAQEIRPLTAAVVELVTILKGEPTPPAKIIPLEQPEKRKRGRPPKNKMEKAA